MRIKNMNFNNGTYLIISPSEFRNICILKLSDPAILFRQVEQPSSSAGLGFGEGGHLVLRHRSAHTVQDHTSL